MLLTLIVEALLLVGKLGQIDALLIVLNKPEHVGYFLSILLIE